MAALTSALVGGAISAVGSLGAAKMGADAQKDAANAARDFAAKGLAEFNKVNVPGVQEQLYNLQKIKSAGNFTPEQEQAMLQQETELKNILVDAQYKQAQIDSLNKLAEVADNGGMTSQDRAQLEQIKNELNTQEKGNRDAILQNAAARGMGGSGTELAAQLSNQQGSATRASEMGFNVAANAEKRALDAIAQRGTLATGMRSQEFGEQKAVADAADTINRFNTAQRSDVQQRNVASKNAANLHNLENDQRIGEVNTGLANQEEIRRASLPQQQFENQMNIARGKSNQLGTMASAATQAGQAEANMYGGIGSGVAKIGSGIADYGLQSLKDDLTKKKPVADVSTEAMTGYERNIKE